MDTPVGGGGGAAITGTATEVVRGAGVLPELSGGICTLTLRLKVVRVDPAGTDTTTRVSTGSVGSLGVMTIDGSSAVHVSTVPAGNTEVSGIGSASKVP